MELIDKINPIFHIDDDMNKLIDDINIKLSNIKITDSQKRKNLITKSKVRSIHSSLSIEANSLSLFDVKNIFENKSIIGKKDEVQEVKNAIEVYNHIKEFDYKSEEDFLKAHQMMMKYFDDDNGSYRNHGEGIKKDDEIIYVAPNSLLVPSLMKSLFEYVKNSNDNLLILAAVFHYYFVYIHPFTDGNGRMARFWVSLILISYNNNFEFIPIEEEIYFNQEKYYLSIEESHNNSNANSFIKFLLNAINISLNNVIMNNNFVLNDIQNRIIELISNNEKITQNEIANILNKNVRTIKRNFKVLIENNIIKRMGSDKTGHWEIINL